MIKLSKIYSNIRKFVLLNNSILFLTKEGQLCVGSQMLNKNISDFFVCKDFIVARTSKGHIVFFDNVNLDFIFEYSTPMYFGTFSLFSNKVLLMEKKDGNRIYKFFDINKQSISSQNYNLGIILSKPTDDNFCLLRLSSHELVLLDLEKEILLWRKEMPFEKFKKLVGINQDNIYSFANVNGNGRFVKLGLNDGIFINDIDPFSEFNEIGYIPCALDSVIGSETQLMYGLTNHYYWSWDLISNRLIMEDVSKDFQKLELGSFIGAGLRFHDKKLFFCSDYDNESGVQNKISYLDLNDKNIRVGYSLNIDNGTLLTHSLKVGEHFIGILDSNSNLHILSLEK